MPANVHLLLGPAGSGKTAALLAHARSRLRRDPGCVLWLAPTRRAIEELRGRIAQTGGMCGLRLLTFADLAEQILEGEETSSRLLSSAQRRLLVEEMVSDLADRRELAHFGAVCDTAGFVEGLLGLLMELQREGVRAAEFTGAALSGKDRECALLFSRYQAELRHQCLHDAEGREARAAEVLRQRSAGVSVVIVDGFSDFTPSQHALIESLRDHLDQLWISLPDENGDERAELFSRPRLTCQRLEILSPYIEQPDGAAVVSSLPAGLAHLGQQLFRPMRRVERSADTAGVTLIEAPGMLGEVRLVARRIKTLVLDGVKPGGILVAGNSTSGP